MKELKSIYTEMYIHSCSVEHGYVNINWEDGSVSIPVISFVKMLEFLLSHRDFYSVRNRIALWS